MKDPAFLFYPNDYLGGTMGFSVEQHGLYILALIFQFNNGHFSEEQINGVLNNQFNIIKHKFKTDGKLYWNERLDIEKKKRAEYCESRRVLIDKRWSKNNKPLSGKRLDTIHTYQQNVVHTDIRMEDEDEDENENEKEDKNKEKTLWKTSFAEYEKQAGEAFDRIVSNSTWILERKKYHPNLDIRLSIEKAFNDFWGQEAGWIHKKKGKSDTINWEATFNNALTLKANQVYEKRN
jgi:hypothetical protein